MNHPRPLALLLTAVVVTTACTATTDQPQAQPQPQAPSAQGVVVQVSPSSTSVAQGGTVPFGATVTGTANAAVTWSVVEAGGGTVSTAGLYTAPGAAGVFTVRATSVADPTKSGSARVTVFVPGPISVAIGPSPAALDACRTLTFTATVTGAADPAVSWSVQEGAAGGSITTAGLYTAPAAAGTYHVTATSVADPTRSATVAITVTERVVGVAVNPGSASLTPSGSVQFTATVTTTCGTFVATGP